MAVSYVSVKYNGTSYSSDFSVNVSVGDTLTFDVTVYSTDGTVDTKGVSWGSLSGASSILTTVSQTVLKKVYTVKAAGTARIYAVSNNNDADGSDVRVYITINASETSSTVAPTGIIVSTSSITISVGETYTLSATVYPTNATDRTCYWTSNSVAIASVGSSSGVVTGVSAGSTYIYAHTNTGGYSDYCKVTVEDNSSSEVLPTSVIVSPSTLTLEVGQTYTLGAFVYPTNATDRTYYWVGVSGGSAIATVDRSTGVVAAVGVGTTTIYCFATSGSAYGTCKVTVEEPSSSTDVDDVGIKIGSDNSWYLYDTTDTMSSNETKTFYGRVWYADNTYGDSVEWSVVSVSESNMFSVSGIGTSTIELTTNNVSGTIVFKCESTEDSSKYHTLTITVTATDSTTVTGVQATYGGTTYSSNFTVDAVVGDSLAFEFSAILDDGNVDSEGVYHATYSADDEIWTATKNNTGQGTLQITLQITAAGTARLKVSSSRDSTKSVVVTITSTEGTSTPTLTGIRVSVGKGEDYKYYYDDFQLDLEMGGGSNILTAVSMGSDGEVYNYNNCVFELQAGSSYITFNTLSDGAACVISPKAVGMGYIKAYCADDETIYLYIIVNVYEDETTGDLGYAAYIYDGSNWAEYVPYIYDGSSWAEYIAYICPFPEEGEEEPTYSVNAVSGADYGFTLNDNGYYESTNQGVESSYSICRVDITTPGNYNLYVDCINYAEGTWDFGILSTLGNSLSLDYSIDSNNVQKSFSGSQSADVQTVDYGVLDAGSYFFYAKYRKDGTVNSNNDSLQFKVRFEKQT